jgi:HEAT repeat protein
MGLSFCSLAWLEGPGSPWADELLALLELEDSRVGWSAGFLLAKMGDRRVIDPIVRCLAMADPAATNTRDVGDEDCKWDELVPALGELKAVEGVDVLSAALPVAHWSIQELIAYALMDIGDTQAVPALAAQLGARHGFFGAAENAIWDALDTLDTPEARSATAAYKRSLDEARPKRRRFWLF